MLNREIERTVFLFFVFLASAALLVSRSRCRSIGENDRLGGRYGNLVVAIVVGLASGVGGVVENVLNDGRESLVYVGRELGRGLHEEEIVLGSEFLAFRARNGAFFFEIVFVANEHDETAVSLSLELVEPVVNSFE